MADDRTPAAAGAGIATPVLATYLGHRFPEAGWSRTEHYAWMSELLGELGILTLDSLEELLNNLDTEAVNQQDGLPLPRRAVRGSTMRCCRRSVIAMSGWRATRIGWRCCRPGWSDCGWRRSADVQARRPVHAAVVPVSLLTCSRNRRTFAGSSLRCQPKVVGRWERSCQKWPGLDGGRVATSHTAVSAPSTTLRNNGL